MESALQVEYALLRFKSRHRLERYSRLPRKTSAHCSHFIFIVSTDSMNQVHHYDESYVE